MKQLGRNWPEQEHSLHLHTCSSKQNCSIFVSTDSVHKPRHATHCRHDVVLREVKDLEKGIAHLHNCMARYNALIADNVGLKAQLVNDNFHLETKISHELKVMLQLSVSVSVSVFVTSLQALELVD